MLEITITKITGNRNKVDDDLYAIELYLQFNEDYTELLLHLIDFFKDNNREIFNREYLVYLYSVNTETKNKFISYLTEIVFSDKFNFLLDIKEINKIRIVYSVILAD